MQLLAGDPRNYAYADFLRFTSQTLYALHLALGDEEEAEATLARLQVGATIAGEGSPNALFLLASAGLNAIAALATPESVEAAQERALPDLQALLLQPETPKQKIERVGLLLADWPQLASELCQRLLAIDERVGRRMAEFLGLGLELDAALASSSGTEDR